MCLWLRCASQGELTVSFRTLVASESLMSLIVPAFCVVVDTSACAYAKQARVSSESESGQ